MAGTGCITFVVQPAGFSRRKPQGAPAAIEARRGKTNTMYSVSPPRPWTEIILYHVQWSCAGIVTVPLYGSGCILRTDMFRGPQGPMLARLSWLNQAQPRYKVYISDGPESPAYMFSRRAHRRTPSARPKQPSQQIWSLFDLD
ncbi:hypothetical protein BaRGS_00006648 [Batillaria attramentaria]|uniref:Uncharacterized protein n=1 Tax=Batillaria attramentaria TaxID=370345 RepID=A0ABD0LTE7_9CAEN